MGGERRFLRSLGLYGLDSIENAILAGLLTGEPILLIGAHGSAKTLLAERIADALGQKFYAYDASKAMFEDVIGFPNPETISKGIIEYVPTPISIWGKEFLLIDEMSRASPSMQNKWLEIVRSRRVMGKKIETLKYIIAAMNPAGYLGSVPLDAALAGRFAFIIKMPEVSDMEFDDVRSIINHISTSDAPKLKISHYRIKNTEKSALKKFISSAAKRYKKIQKLYGDFVTQYITTITPFFCEGSTFLDGRRLGMLSRNLLAYLAVNSEKKGSDSFSFGDLDRLSHSCLSFSLPFEATGEEVATTIITNGHNSAMNMIYADKSNTQQIMMMKMSKDPLRIVKEYEKIYKEMSETGHQSIFSRIEENLTQSSDRNQFFLNFLVLQKVVSLYSSEKTTICPDLLRRALSIYKKFVIPGNLALDFLITSFLTPRDYNNYVNPPEIDFNDNISCLALFVSLKLTNISERHIYKAESRDRAIRLFNSLRNFAIRNKIASIFKEAQ